MIMGGFRVSPLPDMQLLHHMAAREITRLLADFNVIM